MMKKVFAAVGAALLIPAAMFAGDTCATATLIPNGSFPTAPITESVASYTKDNPYDTTASHLQDAWFEFTAPVTALYSFNQTDSNFDNIVTIVDAATCGTLPGAALVGPYDSGVADNAGTVLTAGTHVYVIQGMYTGSTSTSATVVVTQTLLPPAPGNDTCATAIPVAAAFAGNTTDTVTGFHQYVGNLGNTDGLGGGAINDLWFAYTAGYTGFHRIFVTNGEGWLPNGNSDYAVSVYANCTDASTSPTEPLAFGNYLIPGTSTVVVAGPFGGGLERALPFMTSGSTYYVNVEDVANSVAYTTQTIALVIQPTTTNLAFRGDRLLTTTLLPFSGQADGQVLNGTYANDGAREIWEDPAFGTWAANDTTITRTYTFTGLSTTASGSLFGRPNLSRDITSPTGCVTPTGFVDGVAALVTGYMSGSGGGHSRFNFTLTPSGAFAVRSAFFYYAPYGSSTLLGPSLFRATRSAVGAGSAADNLRTGTAGSPLVLTPLDDAAFWGTGNNGTLGDDTDPFGGNGVGYAFTYWAISTIVANNQAGTVNLDVYKHDWIADSVQDWTALN